MTAPTAKKPPKNYIAPTGLQRLRDERRFLLTRERRLRQIDSRISFLTRRIDAAHVVDPEAPRSGRAASHAFFGATVSYRNGAGTEQVVTIVGADEVDLHRRYISWASPLARALMTTGPGDRVVLRAPAGPEHLEILDVRYRLCGQTAPRQRSASPAVDGRAAGCGCFRGPVARRWSKNLTTSGSSMKS